MAGLMAHRGRPAGVAVMSLSDGVRVVILIALILLIAIEVVGLLLGWLVLS